MSVIITLLPRLLLLSHFVLLVTAKVRNSIAERMPDVDNLLFTKNISFELSATELRCGAECLSRENCTTFTYLKPSATCRGYDAMPALNDSVAEAGAETWKFACSPVDSQGWTVFQRRQDGSVDFYRNWTDYVNGFGDACGEYWMGLEALHQLTSSGSWILRIDLGDWMGNMTYATYTGFRITDGADKYRLIIDAGSYTGDAGDGLDWHNDMQFATRDNPNDAAGAGWNCAEKWKGAWWFNNCFDSHLNGEYKQDGITPRWEGINWYYWTGSLYSLKFTEMKIKRV